MKLIIETRDKGQGTRNKRQETRDKRQETRDKRQETRNKRQGTRDKRQETRNKRQETRDKEQETRDKRQETRDKRQETRDKRQETRDKRQGVKINYITQSKIMMNKVIKSVKTHKDLDVWKKSIDFVTELYKTTTNFPKEELYGLSNQMRRAAVSIPSNIAEGAARKSNKEFIQFLYIAMGSLVELETQLIISKNLKLIDEALFIQLDNERNEIGRMLMGLMKYRKTLL